MTSEWYVAFVAAVCLYSLFWIFRAMNSAVIWISSTFPVFTDFAWLLILVILWLIVMVVGIWVTYKKEGKDGWASKS